MRRSPSLRASALCLRLLVLLALPVPWLPVRPALAAEDLVVARAMVRDGASTRASGIVFFLPVDDEVGVAAVGTAHSFELPDLARAGEVVFMLADGERVTVSSRHLVQPGRPFHAQGATLRDDYIVFALDAKPRGVSVLEPALTGLPRSGERVQVVGIPSTRSRNQESAWGTVREAEEERIEVELDEPVDLRGWGGAPVLSSRGRVIGALQAAWPASDTLRVGVSPIGGVLDALRRPLDGGKGRPLAAFDGSDKWAKQQSAAARPTRGTPQVAPGRAPHHDVPDKAPQVSPSAQVPVLELDIEYPNDGAVVGNPSGAFVAGRAIALLGELKRVDVVIVLDTSGSTSEPTGVDVNQNGVVGKPHLGVIGGIFGLGSTDPGDSILSAEIAAARKLLGGLDPRSTRVGVVTFAGDPVGQNRGLFGRKQRSAALTEEPLTTDYPRIEDALTRIRERGSQGMTHMAAGVDQATVELLGLRGAMSKADPKSEKIVLFFTDGQPTLPHEGFEGENVKAVLRAANRARRAGVRIHSFAIGPDALDGPIATVEMATLTEGQFTPVRDPGALINVVEGVSFVNIDTIQVTNLTTKSDAHLVQTHADGSWNALVPVEVGKNRLRVKALSTDGAEAEAEILVNYAPGSADPVLPTELVSRRNRLLEQRLVELRRARLDEERAAAEETRRELRLEMERERAAAAERAAEQRKELELEVDDLDAGDEGQ